MGDTPVDPPSRNVANTILPGTLKGWEVALKTYGTISLAKALAPAILYAEKGFPVYPGLAANMQGSKDAIELFPDYKAVVFPDGRPPKVGEILRFPDYANTLKRISAEGTDLFYKGELAKRIVAFLNENDSRFTLEEFAKFEPRWVELLKTTYRGKYEIYVPKNQNFTPVILTMFNIWENFDLPKMNPLGPDTLHLIAEADKIGLNDRVYYGDPAQSLIPYEFLTSKRYAKAIADLIKMDKVLPDKPGGDLTGLLRSPLAFTDDTRDMDRYRSTTTSIAAVDKDGNVAIITQTIGAGNGSMHIVPGTGIILNNEGTYFDLKPANGPNYPAPGRKVENQMGGAIVLMNGKFYVGAATPTGWNIPRQIAQVLQRVLDHNLSIGEAIELPRIGYRGNNNLRVEPFVHEVILEMLRKKGHNVVSGPASFGMVGVQIDPITGARQVHGDPVFLPTHAAAY